MPLHIVPSPINGDMDACIADLQEGVAARLITGLGVVVMTKGQGFFVDAFGSLLRYPYEGRVMLMELDECLQGIARRRDKRVTTM